MCTAATNVPHTVIAARPAARRTDRVALQALDRVALQAQATRRTREARVGQLAPAAVAMSWQSDPLGAFTELYEEGVDISDPSLCADAVTGVYNPARRKGHDVQPLILEVGPAPWPSTRTSAN